MSRCLFVLIAIATSVLAYGQDSPQVPVSTLPENSQVQPSGDLGKTVEQSAVPPSTPPVVPSVNNPASYDPMVTIQALNAAIMAAAVIADTKDKLVLNAEYKRITDNLKIGNIEADAELMATYEQLMDSIKSKELKLEELERFTVKMKKASQRSFFRAASGIRAYGADPFTFAASLVTSVASAGMNYYEQKEQIQEELEDKTWQLKEHEVQEINQNNKKLLNAAWTILQKYKDKIPNIDDYLLTESRSIQPFLDAQKQQDNAVALRLYGNITQYFQAYAPFWFFYGDRALKAGQKDLARECFAKYEAVAKDIWRTDTYLATIAVNMFCLLDLRTEQDKFQYYVALAEKNLAVQGDGYLRFWLAVAYETLGNKDKAKVLLQQNIDNDVCKAESQLGLDNIDNGCRICDGVENYGSKFDRKTIAAQVREKETPEGKFLRAMLLINSMPDARKIAIDLLSEASNEGSLNAEVWLGRSLLFGWGPSTKADEATTHFENAAKKGSPEGLLAYGLACYYGWGRDKDFPKARELFGKAADSGMMLGQYMLARVYEDGSGTDKDVSKAVALLEQAANKGSVDAQVHLALHYLNGDGTNQDVLKAQAWYELASNIVYPESTDLAATDFLCGWHITNDVTEAMTRLTQEAWGSAVLNFMYLNKWPVKPVSDNVVEPIVTLAESGNAMAQAMLSKCYRDGLGVAKDDAQVFQWAQKSAQQDNAKGLYRLSNCYAFGVGTEKDRVRAFELAKKAANTGDPIALWELAKFYSLGIGTDENPDEEVLCLRASCEKGWFPAYSQLGYLAIPAHFRGQKDFPITLVEGIELLKKGARYGAHGASYLIGSCYEDGVGVDQDNFQAMFWYQRGAEEYSQWAQVALGRFYEAGVCVPQDRQIAYEWYKKAADQGNADGLFNVGRCLWCGLGVKENETSGVDYFTQALKINDKHIRANVFLADCLLRGAGVAKNLQEAIRHLTVAIDQGDARAQQMLGWIYVFGKEVENPQKGFELLVESANQGYARAMANLGYCYRFGVGTATDLNAAEMWYGKGADLGDSVAQLDLGNILCEKAKAQDNWLSKSEKGEEIRRRAFGLYCEAAKQKDALAQWKVGMCFLEGTGTAKDMDKAVEWLATCVDNETATEGEATSAIESLKSMEKNSKEACYELGRLYFSGNRNVARNETKGRELLQKAADKGHKKAINMINEIQQEAQTKNPQE